MSRSILRAAALSAALPCVLAAQEPGVDPAAATLPPDFTGVRIDSLLAAARGGDEAAGSSPDRTGDGAGAPLLLAPLPPADSLCAPLTRYDPDRGTLTVALSHLAGVVALRCGESTAGVANRDGDLDAIARVPLAPDTAEAARAGLRIWLAFRPASAPDRGAVYIPFPETGSVAGLVSTDVALWVTDAAGRVVHREAFRPHAHADAPWIPLEEAAGARRGDDGGAPEARRALSLAEACASPDWVGAVSGLLEPWQLDDLRFQLLGSQMNGEERETTWEEYLARAVERQCNPAGAGRVWPVPLPPDSFTAATRVWGCWSQGERCTLRRTYVAPPGYQICSVRFTPYRRGSTGEATLSLRPDSFNVRDPGPARFRALNLYARADGPYNGERHYAQLRDLRVHLIFEPYDVEERRRRGCDFPGPGEELVPPPPPPPASTPATPARVTAHLYCDPRYDLRSASVGFRNAGGAPGFVEYVVHYRDSNGRRHFAGGGRQSIPPGGSWSHPVHSWSAVGWEVQHTEGSPLSC